MGGKTKQSQRTKNNARPSSSSRSAELLNIGTSLDGEFKKLGNGKPLPPLFPTLVTANWDQGLNPEFLMCIKKLNKKDPITRAKALQELCELVNNGDVEDVVAALPCWAHFYKILTADMDRKVRETTQVCHGAIVRACGRRAAPQLKALVPAWLQAQYDEHAPAQTHAHNSLTSTFPDSKLPEVISFCKVEVMSHLLDNLMGVTEAIISKRVENKEERELQMNRIIISSLQGLEFFTLHLPPAQDEWLWAALAPLLQANAFWKLAQSTPQVRAAWCGALGRVGARFGAGGAFGGMCGARALRGLLGPAPGAAASALWACLLHLMHGVPEWHTYLDKKELLVKRILDVLENGGWGDAKQMSNMLLPLLANLPQDVLTKEFYEAFFNAMLSGLEKKNILHSKSERQSWITSLAECLRYMSIQKNDFVLEITTSVHRMWLEKVLSSVNDVPTRTNLIKCSAINMSSLVKYWLKQSKEESSEKYDQLIRNFWQNVNSTVLAQIDKAGQNEIGILIDGHILLLQTLKTTFFQEPKRQQSIKFQGDEETVPESCVATPEPCDATSADRYTHNLEDSVQLICCHYFESAIQKQVSNAILTPLVKLLVEFDSRTLFMAMSRQFDVDSIYKLYDKVLRTWLLGETMRCEAVVDIVFLLMKHMSEAEQDSVFDTFTQFPELVVEWCLRACVSAAAGGGGGGGAGGGAARRWAREAGGGAATCRLATRVACADSAARADSAASSLLLPAARLCSTPAAAAVLHTLTEAVAPDTSTLQHTAPLAARLLSALPHLAATPQYARLVLRLFQLDVIHESRVTEASWREVRSAWRRGAALLSEADRQHLLRHAAACLHQHLLPTIEILDIARLEKIISPCPYLFIRSDDDKELSDITELVTFTKQIFDINDAESVIVESHALRYECVTSQLNCLYDDGSDVMATVIRDASKNDVKELTKKDLMLYVNKYLFRAIYLRTMLLHKINCNEDEDEPSEQNTWCNVLLKDKYLQDEFCKVLYQYEVICSLHEGYAFWAHYDIIVQVKDTLDSVVSEAGGAAHASSAALQARASAGRHWALAAARHAPPHAAPLAAPLEDAAQPNGLFHSLQASTRHTSDLEAAHRVKLVVMLRSWAAAHGAVLRDVAHGDLDLVIDTYYSRNDTMLYDTDISAAEWCAVVSNVTVVEFLTQLVTTRGWSMPAHYWDFVTISMCSLLASVRKSMHCWASTKVSMLCRAVLRLWAAVRSFVREVGPRCEREEPEPHVAKLPEEWRDVFAPDSTYSLLSIIMDVLDTCGETEMTCTQIEVLGELITCTELVEWDALADAHKLGALSLVRLAHCAAEALQQPAHPAHKYLAYYLLLALAKPLVLDDAEKLSLWSDETSGDGDEERVRPQFNLDHLHNTFLHLHEIVDAALSTVVLGEGTCELVGMSDSYSMALGWLLLGDVVAALGELARGDLAHHYMQIYRERKLAAPLLSASLRLLPDEVFALATRPALGAAPPAPPHIANMFLAVKRYSIREHPVGSDIGALACRGVYRGVCGDSGGARAWAAAAGARAARALERLAAAAVAPHAARRLLQQLAARAHTLPDTSVRILWAARELVAAHTVDERRLELRVTLAAAHPLSPPRLAAPHAAGPGSNTHWLALYLAYQNGNLLDALKMWTTSVNAKVESSPQCYICYCRLHPTSGRLPRVPCHQCRNKFHNECLRKWFASSNKTSCPLCRAAF